jgi:uncharacterized membrane protein YhaH (DUF805 family)
MEWMFMPLKRYAEFSGRSRRMEYWMWQLFLIIFYFALVMLMMVMAGGALMSGDPRALFAVGGGVMIIVAIYCIAVLVFFIPSLAVAVRRLHDTERSGWWLLAPLGPYLLVFVGAAMAMSSPDNPGLGGMLSLVGSLGALGLAITLLVFMLLEGTKGPNKYGPDPKGGVPAQVFT